MKLWHLLLVVFMLSVSIALAATNPTMDAYLAFVEEQIDKALDRHESGTPSRERNMVRTIFRAHSHELVASVVQPHTMRHNWGLFCIFETTALDTHIELLGIAGRFIPIKGMDEATIRLGRLAF